MGGFAVCAPANQGHTCMPDGMRSTPCLKRSVGQVMPCRQARAQGAAICTVAGSCLMRSALPSHLAGLPSMVALPGAPV